MPIPHSSAPPSGVNQSHNDVVVIGAGIIGICAAANLAEAGMRVTVVDRTGICEETSSGNAAGLAFPEILPMAHKGMIAHAPKWLADPLGPLAIPPAYLPKVAPWLYRFWRAGSRARFEAALAAQASLMKLAAAEWAALTARAGTQAMVYDYGALELYESEAEFRAALPGWTARDRFGIDYRHLEQHEIAQYQPGLSRRFARATFMPTWKTVSDPKPFGKAIWEHAAHAGAQFATGDVVAVVPGAEGIAVLLDEGGRFEAGKVVLAAGAWSHLIARGLGDRIPLETERGYNTTLPKSALRPEDASSPFPATASSPRRWPTAFASAARWSSAGSGGRRTIVAPRRC